MQASFEELRASKEHLISQLFTKDGTDAFLEKYTEVMDNYFRMNLQENEAGKNLFRAKKPFALIAVGGYGRSELCLHSDIDIIILFGQSIPSMAKALSEGLFYPLWDLGLDVGHGIRSIKDCLKLCKDDFEVLTSMMGARFICGDSPLYLSLIDALEKKVFPKKAVAFKKWLEERDKIRMETIGDASYLLEPNLKDGIGGLRDYHHMLWLATVFFNLRVPRDLEYLGKLSHNEYHDLKTDLQFIWQARNYLHHLSGRKNDRLHFEYQEKIAELSGFKDENGSLAVEHFLGNLHACMTSVKSIYRSFAMSLRSKAGGKNLSAGNVSELNFDSAVDVLSNPFLLMSIFKQNSSSGRPLSMEAKRLVREFLYLVDDTFIKEKSVIKDFLKIIDGPYTSETLDQMFETGFLERFIPEFGLIKDLVQYDAYHTFPVGRHVLETVRHLKELNKYNDILLHDVFLDLPNHETLFLAALLHDIGKVEKDHARKGISIIRNILKRFAYDGKKTEDILFLVEYHLLLAKTATRRDLNDEKTVVQCARTIGDVKRLKMLYLLTWADSKATGPKAWNEWIASLVRELFFKVMHILEQEELATPHASQKAEQAKSAVRNMLAEKMGKSAQERFLEVISPRYLLNTRPHDIVLHALMSRQLKEQGNDNSFIFETNRDESEGCWKIIFLAGDRPGLFSDLAGVLALNNINILSAEIYTWRDGTAVDILKVTSPLDSTDPERTWKKAKADLEDTFQGKISLDYCLEQKAAPSIFSKDKRPSRPPKVAVDNELSDFFTVIEVFADDRTGLLYLITRALFDLELDIRIAKISTKGDQIADVFYVSDLVGQKVEDKKQLLEIKVTLLHKLQIIST